MKVSRIAIISKEGHGEAKEISRDVAATFDIRRDQRHEFSRSTHEGRRSREDRSEIGKTKFDLVITVSGDGTILRLLRLLDSTIPCLCVNVGGRGILAEIKPDQIKFALRKIEEGDYHIEKRLRISPSLEDRQLPPALNEGRLSRRSLTKTPLFTRELDRRYGFFPADGRPSDQSHYLARPAILICTVRPFWKALSRQLR